MTKIEDPEEGCTCDEDYEDYEEEHSCPYQADVNNDPEAMCSCCPHCTQECANDI